MITIQGVRGKGLKTLLTAPFVIFAAIKQSIRVLKKVNPDAVMGMGGFVSGPGGVASWLLRKPLIIHEQNAKAGMTNKILARLSHRVLEGFPLAFVSSSKVRTIGNPVRREILALPAPDLRLRTSGKFRLLILGGSLGAKALNQIVPKALSQLNLDIRPEVLHQTGDQFEDVQKAYAALSVEANVVPFIKDMAYAYGWADMVLCRAGALTIAELCAAGLGAILVPFPFAVDDHQTANAHFMVKHQAAVCIQQKDLTVDRLIEMIREFSLSAEKRLSMAQAAFELRQIDSTKQFYEILCEAAGAA